MKRIAFVALATTTLLAGAAHAEVMGGLGFRSGGSISAPAATPVDLSASPTIGIRHWVSDRLGLDGAIGFATVSAEGGSPSTTVAEASGFTLDLGVPLSMKSWEKVNVIVRPGFQYATATFKDKTILTPPNEDTATLMAILGEIEVEYMIAERLSISASHGISWRSFKLEDNASPANELTITGFQTEGANFTTLGFHVYLW